MTATNFQERFLEKWDEVSKAYNELDAAIQAGDWSNVRDVAWTPNADEAVLMFTGTAGDVMTAVNNMLADLFDQPAETESES